MMQELNYIRCGDYYIPDIRLPEENRPIGRWGRMHRDYIKEHNPIRFNDLCLSGELWTYLADLNEQAQNRLEIIIEQMKAAEGVTEDMKQHDQMAWVRARLHFCKVFINKRRHCLFAKTIVFIQRLIHGTNEFINFRWQAPCIFRNFAGPFGFLTFQKLATSDKTGFQSSNL